MNTFLKMISYNTYNAPTRLLLPHYQSIKHLTYNCNQKNCIYAKKCHVTENEFDRIETAIETYPTLTKKKAKKSQMHITTSSHKYTPKTYNQQLYAKYLSDENTKIVVATGAAGTGKTLLACQEAIHQLQQSAIQKIILTRPLVSVDEESLGYLPGTLENKMDPWTRPIFDIFHEYYSKQEVEKMIYNGIIEISPLAYMRGRTFKNSWIIADEMQNSSPTQMLMMTTRLGIGSKLIITGDLQQSDKIINHPHDDHIIQQSGLKDFIDRYNYYNKYVEETEEYDMQTPQIRIAYMNTSDIRRSPIVAKILKIYKGNAL